MTKASAFWDRLAERYSRQPIADEDTYRRKLEITQSYLRPDMRVLEFGCGTGGTAIIHAPFVRQIRAFDFSTAMIEIARLKAAKAGVANVDFDVASIETLEAAPAEFDVVLGLSVLHLLKDKDAAVAKVCRLLKPGGVFISSTTCLGDTMAWMKLIAPAGAALGVLPTLDIMSSRQLKACLVGAGLVIEQVLDPGKGKAVFVVARRPS